MSVHPVRDLDELAGLARALQALTEELRAERRHRTDRLTNQLGQYVNGVLWSGSIDLPAAGAVKEFAAPYAALWVYDGSGIGPVSVANVSDLTDAATPGPGRFVVAKNAAVTLPLSGYSAALVPAAAGVLSVAFLVAPITATST